MNSSRKHEGKRIIKASFKGCPIEDRIRFNESHCLLPISVGQPAHEGEKFFATLALINRSFKKCTVLVDDTVQRHTISIYYEDESPYKLYDKALILGDEWIKRNQKNFSMLNIEYDLIRWDKWLNNSKFTEYKNRVQEFYRNNKVYKKAFDSNIEEFLTRLFKNNTQITINKNKAFNFCLEYLIEECAGMCLWAEEGYDFEVYPTGRNTSMNATYETFIKPFYPHVLHPVGIRFKKYTEKAKPINMENAQLYSPQ